MKKNLSGGVAVAVRAKPALRAATNTPNIPGPEKGHEWLNQLVGRWHAEVQMFMEPGKRPARSEGLETVRALGGFWSIAEYKGTLMGKPFRGMLTLGYNPLNSRYVGTWIGSLESYLWRYEGGLDPTGKIMTLESEGYCPMNPGNLTKVREVIELTNKDHRRFISSRLGNDGKWVTSMIINYTRI